MSLFLTTSLLSISSISVAGNLGKDIASQGNTKGATACIGCHGVDGSGIGTAGFPRLAGLNAEYLTQQLKAFAKGSRKNPIMAPIAKSLSETESKAVAEYFAELNSPSTSKPAKMVNQESKDNGAYLALRGSWSDRQLPACDQCHGPEGSGIGSAFPALAGQHAGYIKAQINNWKNNTRKNDPNHLMKQVSDKLTSSEIEDVANYYASIDPAIAKNAQAKNTVSLKPQSITTNSKKSKYFTPPPHSAYPSGPFGESVRNGEAIYTTTSSNSTSKDYVGNQLQCVNCHLDAGRLANSAPMWASWTAYPAYRKKNKKVNDIIMRVQGCFTYSMNAQGSKKGKAPAADSKPILDLMSYMYWMSTDVPTGSKKMAGRGYPKFKKTKLGYTPERGKVVYQARCATCHGNNGQGVVRNGTTLFPPLWGNKSYNWGAGMHKVNKAAFFIKANMPLGRPNSLTEQQAWDVSAYINSHERPQDPRHKNNFKETAKKFHSGKHDYYGKLKAPNGKLLGETSTKK